MTRVVVFVTVNAEPLDLNVHRTHCTEALAPGLTFPAVIAFVIAPGTATPATAPTRTSEMLHRSDGTVLPVTTMMTTPMMVMPARMVSEMSRMVVNSCLLTDEQHDDDDDDDQEQ